MLTKAYFSETELKFFCSNIYYFLSLILLNSLTNLPIFTVLRILKNMVTESFRDETYFNLIITKFIPFNPKGSGQNLNTTWNA